MPPRVLAQLGLDAPCERVTHDPEGVQHCVPRAFDNRWIEGRPIGHLDRHGSREFEGAMMGFGRQGYDHVEAGIVQILEGSGNVPGQVDPEFAQHRGGEAVRLTGPDADGGKMHRASQSPARQSLGDRRADGVLRAGEEDGLGSGCSCAGLELETWAWRQRPQPFQCSAVTRVNKRRMVSKSAVTLPLRRAAINSAASL